MRQSLFVLLCLLSCTALQAQNFEVLVDPLASSSVVDLDGELQTAGSLQGNFDPDSNPSGTQTRIGLSGGSGNMPIPISLDLLVAVAGNSSPEGLFSLDLDLTSLSGTLSGLALELAPGSSFASTASARLAYQTFRTVSPACTFLSLGALTLPLGEIGQIRDISLLQSEAAALQLQSTADPDLYLVEGLIPALLSLVVDISAAGDPLPLAGLPVGLPLSGTLQRIAADRFELRVAVTPQLAAGSLDLGGAELPPIPLPLPCVLPPGAEANLVLNVSANALDYALEFGFELVAVAMAQKRGDPIFTDRFQ